jgi:predicted dehydrogenase
MKIAIVGCGKIADQHVQAIERIGESTVVAVCDREALMAEQLAERFGIAGCYDSVDAMLQAASPDVVHITTPPQSHVELASTCLRAGAHVYMEKPFTVTAAEADTVIKAATSHGRLVTAGHNYQCVPEMLELRQLIGAGRIGAPVHLESYWSYDLGDTSYVAPLLGNPDHWVRRLPGQLLHNIVSHGLARLAEHLTDDVPEVSVLAGRSTAMQAYGDSGVVDELRVLMRDSAGVTAEFCFSTQIKPGQNTLRVYGSSGSAVVDVANGSLVHLVPASDKSYLTFVLPHLRLAGQYRRRAWRNLREILRWRYYQDSGMTELIRCFHRACRDGSPPPIPYREILLVARLMDAIFAQLPRSGGAGR